MSFLTETVAIPVWLLILIICGLIPLTVKLVKVFKTNKREEISREERDNKVRWKLMTLRQAASPGKTTTDVAKEKSREKKIDILFVLKVMAEEGDKGLLLKTAEDRLKIGASKVQKSMQQLIDKKLVEEVIGVSGTKYYLTEVGKKYCVKKGFIRG